MILQLRLAAPVLCGLIASAAWAEKPADLLERMGTALEEASYRGVIIHQQATKTDTFKVYHTMRDGVVRERLVRQEGEGDPGLLLLQLDQVAVHHVDRALARGMPVLVQVHGRHDPP